MYKKKIPSKFKRLIKEFETIVGLRLRMSDEYLSSALHLAEYLQGLRLMPLLNRRREFLGHINRKFRINAEGLKKLYSTSAQYGIIFNFHRKNQIQHAFDTRSLQEFLSVLENENLDDSIRKKVLKTFLPVDDETTIKVFQSECCNPSKLRQPKYDRDFERNILEAAFASFLFCTHKPKDMHKYFDETFDLKTYKENYWEQLAIDYPHLFNQDNALNILRVSKNSVNSSEYESIKDGIFDWISNQYWSLRNYGYLAILLNPIKLENRLIHWELAADITLFAEKHIEIPLNKLYFRSKDIEIITSSYVPGVRARFDLVNEGFSYRDCFVLVGDDNSDSSGVNLLLIFQKNHRDEIKISCPTCRSNNVQGNSYPFLGVRSWECRNPLCPDRSKYNRGKRYSFKAVVMQQAIADENSEIPVHSTKSWVRDVQTNRSLNEILEMLVRHYSLYGDKIHIFNWPGKNSQYAGRFLKRKKLLFGNSSSASLFFNKAEWFKRYVVERGKSTFLNIEKMGNEDFEVYCGDSFDILSGMSEDIFDGAVTSPPYYNAREYTQWENIYCYLYDMYNINIQVYRCLKAGAIYLFNIFDYFDNERSIAFSAMGERRMILSSYIVDLFRRIGFKLLGNIVWDKGSIEGKRGFNSGNFSPYYQSPFNCWEHILIFQKPPSTYKSINVDDFPPILRLKPVIKIIRGINMHGHSAPFPYDIPEQLIKLLPKKSKILDPFAGSLTTGLVAEDYGIRSLLIEKQKEYCKLGLRLREESKKK